MEPDGKPIGAVVLLHGLTDSPYSLRHIAKRYRDRGFVAIGVRLPGHGTVPAGLTDVRWEDWMAATRLAVREARRRVPAPGPLHLVGFSNGGALAMKYALDAIEDPKLSRVDRIVLITPMIGITRFARFAGLAGLPAVLPPFANAAWLSVVPEFNPFKYNSFPVNGARQSYRLTDALQSQIQRLARAGQLGSLPPVLTFQSVVDFTVSTPAILTALYSLLPDNGSEIVLFDVNRTVKFGPLLRPSAYVALERLTPTSPQPYRFTAIVNASDDSDAVVERSIAPGQLQAADRALNLPYPPGIFSLSHLAIPIPMDDPLYGLEARPEGAARVRLQPRRPGRTRRARHAGGRPGLPDAPAVQSVLPVSARTGRRRHHPTLGPDRTQSRRHPLARHPGAPRSPAVHVPPRRRGVAVVRRPVAGKPVPAWAHVNGHGHSPAAGPCKRRRPRAAAGALMASRALPYPDSDTQAVLPASPILQYRGVGNVCLPVLPLSKDRCQFMPARRSTSAWSKASTRINPRRGYSRSMIT